MWLKTYNRIFLFWLFIGVEVTLILKFIIFPIAKIFKLKKGINNEDASKIIGKHFPEVSDKLLNVLQLEKDGERTELLLASINQKASELKPVPFKLAINFQGNLKYLKFAAIPVVIILLTLLTGRFNLFTDSFDRVVHYKKAYEPPAPFRFHVVNKDLKAVENANFKLMVSVTGEVIPENVEILYKEQSYFLQQNNNGLFEYVFTRLTENLEFELMANNVVSRPYVIHVVQAPLLLDFEMELKFPAYIKKTDESLKSTGNAIVPEGTNIVWKLNTKSTDMVNMFSSDTVAFVNRGDDRFELSRKVFNNLSYNLSTSNNNLKNFENMSFNIEVIKDDYPELNVRVQKDSIDLQTLYFYGQINDDYGFSKLQLVYYKTDNELDKKFYSIPFSGGNFSEFITIFPNNLILEEGVSYNLYFEVYDNDAIHNFKGVKSNVFSYRMRTKEEEEDKRLNEQYESIDGLNESLKKFEGRENEIEELSNTQKEKSELNFNDKKKLESFLKRQREQDEVMKKFSEQLKNNLQEFQKNNGDKDAFKKDLEQRFQENEKQLKEDEKLLKEFEKLQEKINKEEFSRKLDELAKNNQNKKRSLQQLLELTKRFYVSKKLEKLQEEIGKQAIEQDKLSDATDKDNTKTRQDALNEDFDNIIKELDQLEKDNKALKKPLEIERDKLDENEIKQEQNNASEELGKEENRQKQQNNQGEEKDNLHRTNAKKSQKKAAQKLKKLGQNLQQSMQMSGGEQLQEDVDMLRQILDNLLLFSFDQESLMNKFNGIDLNHSKYASYLRNQNGLREYFKHIDDSLFALSLRQPKLSETVNKEISNVYFNIDKALIQFADNQLLQGVSYQQYSVTATNNLANFLSEVLDNMEEQLNPSPGNGSGKMDLQLEDIIMSQEELNKLMEDGIKEGEKGQKNGQKNKDGENGDAEDGKQGENTGGNNFDDGALYEIYRNQVALREALEEKMAKEGNNNSGSNLLNKMEEVELDLLNKGFNKETLNKMMELEHQLLKLDNATLKQGEDSKRESKSSLDLFEENLIKQNQRAKEYFKTIEILNRHALPLQQSYKIKVQNYFKEIDD